MAAPIHSVDFDPSKFTQQQAGSKTVVTLQALEGGKTYQVTFTFDGAVEQPKIENYLKSEAAKQKIAAVVNQYNLFAPAYAHTKNFALSTDGRKTVLAYKTAGKGREKTVDVTSHLQREGQAEKLKAKRPSTPERTERVAKKQQVFQDLKYTNLAIQASSKPVKVPSTAAPEKTKAAKIQIGKIAIEARHCDITTLEHDAIVNAANQNLRAGGGVCGAIAKAGGGEIFKECEEYLKEQKRTSLVEGEAMITGGGNLKAHYVIHAVGPDHRGKKETEDLKDSERLFHAFMNSLEIAHEYGLSSIALPILSVGIFEFPEDEGYAIALMAASQFAKQHPDTTVTDITFALMDEKPYKAFAEQLVKYG